jgi:hypothetical protein
MYAYFPYITTGLILFALVVVLRVTERKYPGIKYISASSIISFALVLMLILFKCYAPYASEGWLYYLFGAVWVTVEYLPLLITSVIGALFGVQGYGIAHRLIWHSVAFVVSFVLYTLLIVIVIRTALYLKKKFWSGKALATRQ